MKITYISTAAVPGFKANSVHIMKMCNAFSELGHDVTLLNPQHPTDPVIPGADPYEYYGLRKTFDIGTYATITFPIAYRFIRSISSALSISLQLRRLKPDLVYSRDLYGCHTAVKAGYPVIFEGHIPLQPNGKPYHDRCLARLMGSRKLKRFVVITKSLKKAQQDLGFPNPDLLHVLPDAADIVDTEQLPPHWPGRDNALQIGYVGSVYQGRGIELLFEIAEACPDMDFHIIGGPTDNIQHFKKDAELDNIFFHGHQPHGLTHLYRNACDVLAAPYQDRVYTGAMLEIGAVFSPLKIFEYMSSARPMVCNDLPVLREVLNDEIAMLVPTGSIDGWVAALRKLQAPELRKAYGEKAHQAFLAKHTWKARAAAALEEL